MKTLIPLAFIAASLAACSGTPTAPSVASVPAQIVSTIQSNPNLATAVAVACQIDGQAQPILVTLATPIVTAVAPAAAVAVAGAVAVDNSTVHPAVVAACAAIKGTAVGVVPTAPPATAVAPVAAAPVVAGPGATATNPTVASLVAALVAATAPTATAPTATAPKAVAPVAAAAVVK